MKLQEMAREHWRAHVPGWPLALLRISTGIMFLFPGWRKVSSDFSAEGFIRASIDGFPTAADRAGAPAWYAWFLENVVMAAPGLFSLMVAWGEFLLALALIFGVASRFAAAVGLFLVLNFHLAKGIAFWSAGNYDAIWVLIFFVLAFTAAGRVFGVDESLYRRWPRGRWLW
jgi:thiosulfate dehydrogenase [quinone] large subunit